MRLTKTLVLCLSLLAAKTANAGALCGENFDCLYLRPFVGYEIAQIGAASFANGASGETSVHGVAFGGEAGVRLGPFGFGAVYQRTEALDDLNKGANLNKLYGVFNVNIRAGIMNGVLTAAFGWAMIGAGATNTHGLGGKLGVGLDFYPIEWLSVGPGASFDLQGYSVPNAFIGGYGGTFTARVGVYL